MGTMLSRSIVGITEDHPIWRIGWVIRREMAPPPACGTYDGRLFKETGDRKLADTQVDALGIAAGPGGYHAAIRLGQLGKNVVCFDRDEVGGVCLNWGCIPTKALLHVGELTRPIDHRAEIGLKVPKAEVDREGVAAFKDKVVKANVGGVGALFKANNVTFAY